MNEILSVIGWLVWGGLMLAGGGLVAYAVKGIVRELFRPRSVQ